MAQENDTVKVIGSKCYIKDATGEIHYYDRITNKSNKYQCYNDDKITVYKPKEIQSGFMRFRGEPLQFIYRKIKKQNGIKTLVKGKVRFEVKLIDNGNMILMITSTSTSSPNSNLSYMQTDGSTSTITRQFLVNENEVSKIPALSKSIDGWENIFTSCPNYKKIFEQFNNRQKGDYWSVDDLIQTLSAFYFDECFVEI